jgi:hypothetical protein
LLTGVWLTIPQATEWQNIGNQIDATMIFARADFVNVHRWNERFCRVVRIGSSVCDPAK